jgi:SAM-dependent methyltransferase
MLHFLRKFSNRLFFRLMYLQKPRWDTGVTPPELEAFVQAREPGRSLDLGCGTGTNVLYLRQHGWEANGVDFVPRAVKAGQRKARRAGLDVNIKVGDVSSPAVYEGQYNLILDIGCYHTLNPIQRESYRKLVAGHLAADGTYMLYGFTGDESRITPGDMDAFKEVLTLQKRVDSMDGSGPTSAWFWWGKR